MAKKITIDDLKKYAKKLNKLDLTDEEIDLDTEDFDEMAEEFMSAMEEIDDDKKTDEVDDAIIKFYVKLMEQIDGKDSDSSEENDDMTIEKAKEMDFKELKTYIKDNNIKIKTKLLRKNSDEILEELEKLLGSSKKKDKKSKNAEFDRDALEEKLEDMEYKEVKAFIKDNNLDDIEMPKKSEWDDEQEDTIEEILDAMEEKAEKKNKKDKKGKKGKKDKGNKKDKDNKKDKGDLPKGMRKDSIPHKVYELIKKGDGCSVMDIAKLVAKEKKMDADKLINHSVKLIAKSIAKASTIQVVWSNSVGLEDGKVTLLKD